MSVFVLKIFNEFFTLIGKKNADWEMKYININCRVVVTKAIAAVDFSKNWKIRNVCIFIAMRIVFRFSITVIGNSSLAFVNVPVEKKKNSFRISESPYKLTHEFIQDANFNVSIVTLRCRV